MAACVDWRYDRRNREQLWFVFRGAPLSLIVKVFRSIVGNKHSFARGAYVRQEHDVIRRNRHGYYRLAVMIIAPDWQFARLETMKAVIAGMIARTHPSGVKWLNLHDFLNV